MPDKESRSDHAQDLRKRAEEKADQTPDTTAELSSKEVRQVLHELRVHQIELEMQNDELRHRELELEASREKYFDLYDLAPAGYVLLNEKGIISEANLTAATMLGRKRGDLVGQPLSRFMHKEDHDIYYLCHNQ